MTAAAGAVLDSYVGYRMQMSASEETVPTNRWLGGTPSRAAQRH